MNNGSRWNRILNKIWEKNPSGYTVPLSVWLLILWWWLSGSVERKVQEEGILDSSCHHPEEADIRTAALSLLASFLERALARGHAKTLVLELVQVLDETATVGGNNGDLQMLPRNSTHLIWRHPSWRLLEIQSTRFGACFLQSQSTIIMPRIIYPRLNYMPWAYNQ